MTITELNETIEIMRRVYPFNDDKTDVSLCPDMRSMTFSRIQLDTFDEETNTDVHLERKVDKKKAWVVDNKCE